VNAIHESRNRALAASLTEVESRNITFVDRDFPIFWDSATQATVTDVDGKRYIDLTAAFGVANVGHGNPAVTRAIAAQASRLMHAMGDVHPAALKVELLETLTAFAPDPLQKTILGSTGADAVEAALKTAMIVTGKPRFAAFRNGYHGLSLGTLQIAGIERFRAPFAEALAGGTLFLDYPRLNAETALEVARSALKARGDLAAIVVEPVQGRGGCNVPAHGYLRGLRSICDEFDLLLICDEVYTGFGRTGTMFAVEYERAVPDILCVGKAMANGFPISAAIAGSNLMDAWPPSSGEALHTSTFLGNPMGCAAALATIAELQSRGLCARAQSLGELLEARLRAIVDRGKGREARGRGLMWGIELASAAAAEEAVRQCLRKGVLVLQAGAEGNVLSLTPPLVIPEQQLFDAIDILESVI